MGASSIGTSYRHLRGAVVITAHPVNKMPTPIPYPADPTSTLSQLEAFIKLVRILREQCPWDIKQTHASISHLLIEEAYETTDAIATGNDVELAKELGDILLHVVMHSVIAEQRGAFDLNEVVSRSFGKLVNRHPHIFADAVAITPDAVLQNWERLKMNEGRTSVLDGVPSALPAALRSQRVQDKAANVGFDWHDRRDVWAKVNEELSELRHEIDTENKDGTRREFGDVFFALVNAARHEGVIAEDALHNTTNSFMRRFQHIEARAREMEKDLHAMTLDEMDEYWNEAKGKGL